MTPIVAAAAPPAKDVEHAWTVATVVACHVASRPAHLFEGWWDMA